MPPEAVRKPVTGLTYKLVWRAHRLRLAWPLKAGLSLWHAGEKAQRRTLARSLPLDERRDAAARTLRREGWAVATNLSDPRLLRELREAGEDRVCRADELTRAQRLTHKSFWMRLLDGDLIDERFSTDNVFVRFATQPALVNLVTGYLGELPMLVDVLLTLSHDGAAELGYSQLWHKDYDDAHTIKVFVYLTDVKDSRDGPFTLLPGPLSDRIGITRRSHLADAKVFSSVDRRDVKEVFGAALTTFACETSRCLHMGSRVAPGHSRLMYTATYIPAPMIYPGYVPKFRAAAPLDTPARLLLGL